MTISSPIKVKKLIKDRRVPIAHDRCFLTTQTITVEVDRRDKAGKLIYPYVYQIDPGDARLYPMITRPGGWPGYAVPLGAFRKVAKRGELFNA